MQLNIGIEKMDMHEDMIVKALLDSSATEMFMDRKITTKHRFRLQKLERLVTVRNMDRMNNSTGAITYQVKVNVYSKSHVERIRMNICNLGRIKVILGIPQLQVHNLEINQKIGEVKIIRCLPLCGRNIKRKENKKAKRGKRIVTLEEKKIVKQVVNNKKDQGREEKVKVDHRKIEEMVPKKFSKQRKVFGKLKSERMPMRKIWDYAIDLKV